MKNLKFGIIGCANIVQTQIAHAMKETGCCELSTIAGRDPNKAKQWSKKLRCDYEQSYDDVLKRDDIEAVYIPLPIGLHKKWVIKSAEAGKHIVCEKSLSDNFTSVKKMITACEKNNVVLFEDFMCNYHPQHEKTISIIKDGDIGKIFLFRGFFGFPPLKPDNIRYSKSLGGGSLNDVGAYPLFMSRKILSSEPIYATCKLFYGKNDVDIQGNALIEFPGDVSAFISFGFNNLYQNNYSIWGSRGLINVNRAFSIPKDMKPSVELIKQGCCKNIDILPANHFTLLFRDFCSKVNTKERFDFTALMEQARAMEALRISSRKNKKVCMKDII